jgi:hypothetical protein
MSLARSSTAPSSYDAGAVVAAPTHPAFELVRVERIPEHSATAALYRHSATGAQVLSVMCAEEEKVFGIGFPTPVSDDTGVPHILEHSVLCGSARYPVKEPFVQLLKSSLQTYLNAMTYPDRTVYPVASPNQKDFHHLIAVYLDAVFAPRLEPWVLKQEGWHLDAPGAAPDATGTGRAALAYSGVVFNEMKGVFSAPDALRSNAESAALFPASTYRFVSGGDPLAIPRLTYDQFVAFHRTHYAPHNARVWFFGDDDAAQRLRIMDAALSDAAARWGHAGGPGAVARGGSALEGGDGLLPTTFHARLPAPVRVNAPYPPATAADGEDGAAAADEEAGSPAHSDVPAESAVAAPSDDAGVFVDFSRGAAGAIVHPSADLPGSAPDTDRHPLHPARECRRARARLWCPQG